MKHFFRKEERITKTSRLIEGIAIASGGGLRSIYAALVSQIVTTDGVRPLETAISDSLFCEHLCASIKGDPLSACSEQERVRVEELVKTIHMQFDPKAVGGNGKHPWWEGAKRLQGIVNQKGSLDVILRAMLEKLGRDVDAEGGKPLPWQEYCESINKGIPVLLSGQTSKKWLVSYGYVLEDEKRYLLICDSAFLSTLDLRLKRGNLFPDAGFWFEEFDKGRYTPYFIHNWRASAKFWNKNLEEIMRSAKN